MSNVEIIAWQHLPEPYKKDDTEMQKVGEPVKNRIAKKILKMEKDKLMSKSKFDRDWELITALDIAIESLDENTKPQSDCVKEIIDELESRKSYGVEYAQAIEDVIVILKAKFGLGEETDDD
jgi:hypothetical protein